MAHTCPDCGETCYCGGDIDDIILDGGPEESRCTHCLFDEEAFLEDYDPALDGDDFEDAL